jgi:hypothetical protein
MKNDDLANWARLLIVLVVAATLAGCVFSVPEPMVVREPKPEQLPLQVGVYFSPELRNFTYRHHLTDTAWILGKPSVGLLSDALGLLFTSVVEVAQPGSSPSQRGDLAAIIEPRITSAGVVYWSSQHIDRGTAVQPVHVTYSFTMYTSGGQRLALWEVNGRGEAPNANPLAGVATAKRNFEHAMREAAWKFTSGFRDVPEVRRWLEERGVKERTNRSS